MLLGIAIAFASQSSTSYVQGCLRQDEGEAKAAPSDDVQHPVPTYSRRPVVTSLDLSSDGQFLAVAAVHEVYLLDASTLELSRRLIGLSPRIESLKFSPDSQRLAVVGGGPAEFGELQIWDVASGQQLLSQMITSDTLFGVSWSPDGTKVAFGATDTSVRAIEAASGKQVLFQNASEDWVRDTVFSKEGSHLVTVGRDMACKLTEVATERFVDNITSITPGILKGGIAAVARHPSRDEVLIGGADGTPKLYRIFRQTNRVIGDDANLIRRFPAIAGRIQAVSISDDGKRFAVGTSLDGAGEIRVYGYDFDTTLPEDVKAVMAKVVSSRTGDEHKKVEDYVTKDIQLISSVSFPTCGIYALDFDRSGKVLIAGGADGQLKKIDSDSGAILTEFSPITLADAKVADGLFTPHWNLPIAESPTPPVGSLADLAAIDSVQVMPAMINLASPIDYAQLVVMGVRKDGSLIDVTQIASFQAPDFCQVDGGGLLQPLAAGSGQLKVSVAGKTTQVPLVVNYDSTRLQFVRDIEPMLTRVGCNAGTCHGSADGKKGFKLSLRGYDPIFDLRSLTDDLSSRRVNIASPDLSLMLLKASSEVEHAGGQVFAADSKYYSMVRQWISDGASLESQPIRVQHVEIQPKNPVLDAADSLQQMRVIAFYQDGSQRDVTREAFVESANLEVATISPQGLVKAVRRGETAVLARYDGAYVATTLTVMGDRSDFVWQQPESFNQVDQLVAEKWQRMKIQPSDLCSDNEYVRRLYLDLTGMPPSVEVTEAFVSDARDTKVKRDELVDRLIGCEEFVDHWTNKWSDLLQVNGKFLGREGATAFHAWIRQQVQQNTPYDKFVHQIMTATGSTKQNPAASYFKILREPDLIMENTTHLFLATRFNCNKCHDHPFERWTQDQYYETAAFFSQTELSKDPNGGDQRIGGTAVEDSNPLYEVVMDATQGDMIHDRTKEIAAPKFPFGLSGSDGLATPSASQSGDKDNDSRRKRFADWLTSEQNPYFATSYVNRLWGYLTGVGLIEPLDDLRASNPPSNPKLLEFLRQEFLEHDFDVRHMLSLICKSRTYQLSVSQNRFNAEDNLNYSHAKAKRLPAEVLFDSMHYVTGVQPKIPGVAVGVRAAQIPDSGIKLPSGFLATLGRPERESSCECERSDEMQLGSVLAMLSGPDQARLISDPTNAIAMLAKSDITNEDLANQIYLRILNRSIRSPELELVIQQFQNVGQDHTSLSQAVQERQSFVDQQRDGLEKERQELIALVEADLNEFVAKTDPGLLKREAEQASNIQKLQTELERIKSNEDTEFLRWRTEQLQSVNWHPIAPVQLTQSSGGKIDVLADRSIRASESKGATETIVVTKTDLSKVSAIRLEALADETLASKGPGLAANGNFVLSEMKIEVASLEQPDDWKEVQVSSTIADFQQDNFSPDKVFNGKTNDNGDGWAIDPNTGVNHWFTAQLTNPIEFPAGGWIRFRLLQNYTGDSLHQLGRFRISLATATQDTGLSVSEELLAQLVNSPQTYVAETKERLLAAYRLGDSKRITLERQLAQAREPVMLDEGIVQRRQVLDRAQLPVPEDRRLEQLQADFQYSKQQLENLRLTVAQDLTWALLNSPSFLFNR